MRRPEAASRGEAASQTAEGRRPEAEVSAEGPEREWGQPRLAPSSSRWTNPTLPATPEQWERLMHVTKGSKVKALKLINLANGVNYASSTMDGATRQEVSLAITKGTE